jgi:UDP-N-acetylmuramoyl-tripeptide--D-alanyl-D-alanine ligase
MAPVEERLGRHFVATAAERLGAVAPTIVGVTGSYGKTSTKGHIVHLLQGTRTVVASPASFNNRAGLARAVNEQLAEGTEVFVAEMGTYGPGEIADLCRWCPPAIAVITAIGPVHLERFGSEDRILEAKSEIVKTAKTVVLNIDDARLRAFAQRLRQSDDTKVIVACSGVDRQADVCVLRDGASISLFVSGQLVGAPVPVDGGGQPTNLACAAAVALALGAEAGDVAARLGTVPPVASRLHASRAPSGVVVIDDTFNSNPAGASAALELLAGRRGSGRRVVVTPGMVELGPRQFEENRSFARHARELPSEVIVVGRTNRRALSDGAAPNLPARDLGAASTRGADSNGGGAADGDGNGQPDAGPIVRSGAVLCVRTRDEAVTWVRDNLRTGDVVLYENDLPDHYP